MAAGDGTGLDESGGGAAGEAVAVGAGLVAGADDAGVADDGVATGLLGLLRLAGAGW